MAPRKNRLNADPLGRQFVLQRVAECQARKPYLPPYTHHSAILGARATAEDMLMMVPVPGAPTNPGNYGISQPGKSGRH